MRRLFSGAAVCVLLVISGPAGGTIDSSASDEGCEAQNPLSPTCTYTVTHTSATPVTGAGGIGDWVVTIKRGRQTLKFESLPDGRPTFLEISFKVGDKVTGEALSPGSGVTVGHFDP